MAFSLVGKALRDYKFDQHWSIYQMLLKRPMSFVEVCSQLEELFRVKAFSIQEPERSNNILGTLSQLERFRLVHCPVPVDAHLPFQGWESKPEGHWKYYLKRRIGPLELRRIFFPKMKRKEKGSWLV